ncbi:MAG: hypothetical protein JSR89_18470 [Proteobacteria bacterium]|nr:hypothetical protein [Pseudomonadota bacterium]
MLNLPVRGSDSAIGGGYRRDYISHVEITSFLRRYLRTIVGTFAVALSLATIYLIHTPPTYTARAQLLIEGKPSPPVRGSSEDTYQLDGPQVESQIAVLRSETIARGVVDTLSLDHDVDFMGVIRPGLVSDDLLKQMAIEKFIAGLEVGRIDISYAISIGFNSKSPQLAAKIANTTAAVYLRDLVDTRARAAHVGSDWLEKRVNELRKQMNAAARRVQEFKASQDYRIDRSAPPEDGDDKPQGPKTAAEEPPTLDVLESTAISYRKIYENFYQAFMEAVQRESYPVMNARVISVAAVPTAKSYPKPLIVLALGSLGGILLGFAIALARNALAHPVRFSHQVREELGLRSLGDIPKVLAPVTGSLKKRLHDSITSLWQKAPERPYAIAFTEVLDAPYSVFSEAIRRVRTTISLGPSTEQPKTIGIVSSMPYEGKSTIAANLAVAFAINGGQTLLVDADIRNRTLSKVLAPTSEAGIADIIAGLVDLETSVLSIAGGKIDFLPAGAAPSVNGLAELSTNDVLKGLIDATSKKYSVVIFDLPASHNIAYAIPVASMLDGVVLIAESEATPMALLNELAINLRAAQANILGCAVTKAANRHFTRKAQIAYAG